MSSDLKSLAKAARKGGRRKPIAFPDAPRLFDAPPSGGNASLKNRIRSVKRLLKKELPPQARKDKARLLKKLERQLLNQKFDKQEHRVGAKYHKAKFFDRRKAVRLLGRAEKELASCTPGDSVSASAAAQRVRELQLDVLYTRWYPRHKKYISLFPRKVRLKGLTHATDPAAANASENTAPAVLRRIQRMRRWALANAAAAEYLRIEPTADVSMSEQELDMVVSRRIAAAASSRTPRATHLQASGTGPHGRVSASDDRDSGESSEDDVVEEDGDESDISHDDHRDEDEDDDDDDDVSTISTQFSDDENSVDPEGGEKEKAQELKPLDELSPSDAPVTASGKVKVHRAVPAEISSRDTSGGGTVTIAARSTRPRPALSAAALSGADVIKSIVRPTAALLASLPPDVSRSRPRVQAASSVGGNDDEEEGDAAVALGNEARHEVAADPFFALSSAAHLHVAGAEGDSSAAPPVSTEVVFRELDDDDEPFGAGGDGGFSYVAQGPDVKGYGEGGIGGAGRFVVGSGTAAARYEREHLSAKRYRDTAAARASLQSDRRLGSGGERESSHEGSGPDLSHLSGRKRRRAERAQVFAASTRGNAGGFEGAGSSAIIPHAGKYREAFFGTASDPGAVLRSRAKLDDRRDNASNSRRVPPPIGRSGMHMKPSTSHVTDLLGSGYAQQGTQSVLPAGVPTATLSGRALKRAERAAEHAAKKRSAAASAPEVGRPPIDFSTRADPNGRAAPARRAEATGAGAGSGAATETTSSALHGDALRVADGRAGSNSNGVDRGNSGQRRHASQRTQVVVAAQTPNPTFGFKSLPQPPPPQQQLRVAHLTASSTTDHTSGAATFNRSTSVAASTSTELTGRALKRAQRAAEHAARKMMGQ